MQKTVDPQIRPVKKKLPLGQQQNLFLRMKFEDIRYRKMTKKCAFFKIKNCPTLLNQNLGVFSMDNVFSGVLEKGEEEF